jgi:hypothetical protein
VGKVRKELSGTVRKIIKPVLADESEKADTVYMIRQLLLGSFESAFSLAVGLLSGPPTTMLPKVENRTCPRRIAAQSTRRGFLLVKVCGRRQSANLASLLRGLISDRRTIKLVHEG